MDAVTEAHWKTMEYANPRSIFKSVSGTSITWIASHNPKRIYLIVECPWYATNGLYIILSYQMPTVATILTDTKFSLGPGQPLNLSRYGDTPWMGPVYAIGYGSESSSIEGIEMSEWPYDGS